MREIKFRAWDKVNKVMLATRESWLKTWRDADCDPDSDYDFKKLELYISKDGHVLEDTFEHGVCDLHYYLQGEPKYELMQYTGLKDKNGKEIYEGDIVQVGAGIMFPAKLKVEWLQFGYVLTAKDYINSFRNTKSENIKVIGNIYEDPNLLGRNL